MICSERALEEQGIPKSLWSSCVGPASVPVKFDTGGGFQGATESVDVVSPSREDRRLTRSHASSCDGFIKVKDILPGKIPQLRA
eukprot:10103417-Karenia_brevis.AAC.1